MKEREYSITHAQDLLDLEKKMGVNNWKLTDSKFMLKNGIIQRANSGPDKGAKAEGAAGKGTEA